MAQNTKKLSILVVEDEGLVAMLIEDMLMEMGHVVAAVVAHMPDGVDLARDGKFDLAIIDVNLDGQPSYPIAEILRRRGIPFIFATGYGAKGLDAEFVGTPTLAKPFASADLEKLLLRLVKSDPSSM
ncbi:MAG TPA: response regulator [Pirellulales bacterium]|jgi:CheY-like chemotaxis protein